MATEFGGSPQRNRVQPPPHEPTASEQLMLGYTTGDESGESPPDNGEAFDGLLPLGEVVAPEPLEFGYEGPE